MHTCVYVCVCVCVCVHMCLCAHVCVCVCVCVCVQKWLNALNEHIAFSTHYTHQGEKLEEEEEELVPLGTMQDSLQVRDWYQREINLVCVCVCVSVVTCVFVCEWDKREVLVCVCVCTHALPSLCNVCVSVCMDVDVCMACACVCVCVCLHVCMHASVHVDSSALFYIARASSQLQNLFSSDDSYDQEYFFFAERFQNPPSCQALRFPAWL